METTFRNNATISIQGHKGKTHILYSELGILYFNYVHECQLQQERTQWFKLSYVCVSSVQKRTVIKIHCYINNLQGNSVNYNSIYLW